MPINILVTYCDYCRYKTNWTIGGITKDHKYATIVCQTCGNPLTISINYLQAIGVLKNDDSHA